MNIRADLKWNQEIKTYPEGGELSESLKLLAKTKAQGKSEPYKLATSCRDP